MPFADDLLEQAHHLATREEGDPKQASLRRAVSTAYYALFHLLIDEAVSQWSVERQRSILARTFDHGKMKGICDSVLESAKGGGNLPAELRMVASNFIQLQQHRHVADYDNAKDWSRTDVENVLTLATDAFEAWRAIRTGDAAKDICFNYFCRRYLGNEASRSCAMTSKSVSAVTSTELNASAFEWSPNGFRVQPEL